MNQTYLKSIFHYEPETGWFTWVADKKKAKAGNRAGTVSKGRYRHIKIDYKCYQEHQLAFLYMTGFMPSEIDHRNLNGLDNSWGNLRPATHFQNLCNIEMRKSNTSGFTGVYPIDKKWFSKIKHQTQVIYLGTFDSPEKASNAYKSKALELRGEFARV